MNYDFQINKLKEELNNLQKTSKKIKYQLQKLIEDKKTFENDKRKLSVDVTDHAIIRYMERYMNLDINSIKNEIKNKYIEGNSNIDFKVVKNQIRTIL